MRRLVLTAVLAALVLPASGAPAPPRHWATPHIRTVVAHGLLAGEPASFRPDDALTRAELEELVAGLTGVPMVAPPRPEQPVTVATLDARVVRALGFGDAAATFARGARAAGLAPPARFGTEVVARLLGLRENHDAESDALERLPSDPATRAQAAYSAARILSFAGWEREVIPAAAASFTLPTLNGWQRRVLRRAVSLVGYPYVWAGESERPAGADGPFGPQAQGGFDCSGFIWRVFKLERYEGAPQLAETLRGRTTYSLSAEPRRPDRIPLERLEPADVVFFGARGTRSRPADVDHAGIYLGGGWIVHSSRDGVALTPLSGSRLTRFAWARRPLAEARLSGQ
jgi:cell wall-associated NlpC family hydrolase